MPDQMPTPSQMDAYTNLRRELTAAGFVHLLNAIDPLLPSNLTSPLPTEPGPYQQETDGAVLILSEAGSWWRAGNMVAPAGRLVPLVPKVERAQFTGVELRTVWDNDDGGGVRDAWDAVAEYVNTKGA